MGFIDEIRTLSRMIARGGLMVATFSEQPAPEAENAPCLISSLIQIDADIVTQVTETGLASPEILKRHSEKLNAVLSLINNFNLRLVILNRSAWAGMVTGSGLGFYHSPHWFWATICTGSGLFLIRTCILKWLHLKIKQEIQAFHSGKQSP